MLGCIGLRVTNNLPPEELSSFITRLFPIGLPMPGSLFSFFTTLAPLGEDEADEQYDKYDSHII